MTDPTPAEAPDSLQAAITSGRAIVCYTRCWPCQFGDHFDPPKPHTWMDEDDAEHVGHPWPLPDEIAVKNPCACPCVKEADRG